MAYCKIIAIILIILLLLIIVILLSVYVSRSGKKQAQIVYYVENDDPIRDSSNIQIINRQEYE